MRTMNDMSESTMPRMEMMEKSEMMMFRVDSRMTTNARARDMPTPIIAVLTSTNSRVCM